MTAARAQALLATSARGSKVAVAQARAVMARAPYQRAALRYLYAEGWIGGRKARRVASSQGDARIDERRVQAAIAKDTRLRRSLGG